MGILLGDIVKDRETGVAGVVQELSNGGAWVKIDPAFLNDGEENKWFISIDRLIRL